MRNAFKYIWLGAIVLFAIIMLKSCTYYDPNFDNTPGAVTRQGQAAIPYNTWIDQMKQTDQKRYQEYVLLRKHIDSNHAVVMYRIHNLQDTVMVMQYANNQQIVNLRREVHRLSNAVYFMLIITVLLIGYLVFEHWQKRKKTTTAKTIPYMPVQEQEALPAVIMPTSEDEEKL
jgi:hypothetical protein